MKFIPIAMALALAACSQNSPVVAPEAKVVHVGTFAVGETRSKPAPGTAAGKVSESSGVRFGQSTDRIAATPGIRFGLAYAITGPEQGTVVPVRRIWRFPEPGLQSPTTGQVHRMEERETTCTVGGLCMAGWAMNLPWEMVPGTWNVEIWHGDRLLIKQAFQVTIDPPKS